MLATTSLPLLAALLLLGSPQHLLSSAQAQAPAESSGPATWDAVRVHIAVYSTARRHDRRLLIRSTWMRYLPPTIRVDFVLGAPIVTPEGQKPDENDLTALGYLTAENKTFGDLIFLDLPESTKIDKMVALAEYQDRMLPDFDFYGKADDDVVVHPYNLYMHAWTLPRQELFWGWCLPGGDLTPDYPYMCGAFYLFSKDVMPCLGASSKHNEWVAAREHYLQWDDMNLGIFYHWCSGKINYTRPGMYCVLEERFFQYTFALHEGAIKHPLHNTTVLAHPLKPIRWFTDLFNAFKPNLEAWTACFKAGTPPNRCAAWGQQFGPFKT